MRTRNLLGKAVLAGAMLPIALIDHAQTINYENFVNCSDLNYDPPPKNPKLTEVYDHINNSPPFVPGSHGYTSHIAHQCTYTGGPQTTHPIPCLPRADSTPQAWPWENGSRLKYDIHDIFDKVNPGGNYGPLGGTASSQATTAQTVTGCLNSLTCVAIPITISGITVTFGGGSADLQEDSNTDSVTCTAFGLTGTVCTPNPPNPPGPPPSGQVWTWDTTTCSWQSVYPPNTSPIVVFTKGPDWKQGEMFSNPKSPDNDYVTFKLDPNGPPMKLSWPLPESGVAFLVLPDAKGNVVDGNQVFGNLSPHANGDYTPIPLSAKDSNGITALAFYDQGWDLQGYPVPQGGDGNVILDKRDKIWSRLRLWYAKNCFENKDAPCHSLPGELVTLQSQGITSISLAAGGVGYVDPNGKLFRYDEVGNDFRWWVYLNPDAETQTKDEHGASCCAQQEKSTKDGRKAVDVYLVAVP